MDELARGGVEHVAVCPGSRSTPLSLAARHHPSLHVRVILDERDAGFWALGIAKASGRPAAVITTSGTAVANLLPAVVEASNAAVPLVLVTADRPEDLRGKGSNQTIEQEGIFGAFVRYEADLPHPAPNAVAALEAALSEGMAAAVGRCPGPVHLNQPLRKPLEPTPEEAQLLARIPPVAWAPRPRDLETLETSPIEGKGIIVAGPGPVSPADALRIHTAAKTLGAQVLADPLSGLRTDGAICHYDAWIEVVDPAPDWIIQFGAAPTSKPLGSWLRRLDDRRIRIDETGRRWDEGHPQWIDGEPVAILEAMAASSPATGADPTWKRADEAAVHALDATGTEAEAVLAAAHHASATESTLFVGNSLAVRELDRYAGACPMVLGNRGASGIDGNLATIAGIADAAGPAIGVLGDLAFQHDVGGLALIQGTAARIVVVSNGGGAIFRHLPIADQTEHFSEIFLTPQTFDIGAACAAFGVSHVRIPVVDTAKALDGPTQVVEVVVDAKTSAAKRRAMAQSASEAAVRAWRQS